MTLLLQDDESDAYSHLCSSVYVSSLLEACAHPQPCGLIVLRRILPKEVILQS